jgi:hypothetical protein
MRMILCLLIACPALAVPPESQNGLLADLGNLPLNPASFDSIEGLVDALADDPGTLDFLNTIIECALPFQTELTVGEGDRATTFVGQLGLAPEWLDGPCEEACQEWVSACMMARTNAYGLPVDIFFVAENEHLQALNVAPADRGFGVREAAFYGNLFGSPALAYACRGDHRDPLALTWRVCGRPGSRCAFENVGPCGPIDGETGEAVEGVCELTPTGDFRNCRTSRGRVYTRVVTIYMVPTSFRGALVQSCGEPPPSTPGPTSAGPVGAPCLHDSACAEGLVCDVDYIGQGICTRFCGEGEADEDETLCTEPGTTCLRAGRKSFCTPACEPGEPNTCAPGQICTGLWLQLENADTPGCLPFCQDDSQCGTGTACNPRTGTCGRPYNANGLEDGEPCNPQGEDVCRGLCFQTDPDPTRGLCGSLIDRGRQDDCSDRPGTMTPLRPGTGDDLALCIYRQCSDNDDCTAPLRCVRQPLNPGQCAY